MIPRDLCWRREKKNLIWYKICIYEYRKSALSDAKKTTPHAPTAGGWSSILVKLRAETPTTVRLWYLAPVNTWNAAQEEQNDDEHVTQWKVALPMLLCCQIFSYILPTILQGLACEPHGKSSVVCSSLGSWLYIS